MNYIHDPSAIIPIGKRVKVLQYSVLTRRIKHLKFRGAGYSSHL